MPLKSSFPDSAHQTGHADLPHLGFRTRVFLSLRLRKVVPIVGQPDLRCPPAGILGRKMLALVVRPAGQPPKTSRRCRSDFSYAWPIFQEARLEKKRRNVVLSRARFGFWPLFGR